MSLFGDINKVELLGNITSDPEIRYTPNGAAVCSFSLATNRRYKQGETWKDETSFHNIVVWANLATSITQRAKKGTRVLVTGRLQTRSWDSKDGKKNYKTEVIADDVFLIDRYERGKMENNIETNPANNVQVPVKPTNYTPDDSDIINPDDLPF